MRAFTDSGYNLLKGRMEKFIAIGVRLEDAFWCIQIIGQVNMAPI